MKRKDFILTKVIASKFTEDKDVIIYQVNLTIVFQSQLADTSVRVILSKILFSLHIISFQLLPQILLVVKRGNTCFLNLRLFSAVSDGYNINAKPSVITDSTAFSHVNKKEWFWSKLLFHFVGKIFNGK